jgi:hypothetical protein
MLRLHTAGPAPTKNPRCRMAGEGARRDELSSADTLTYEERSSDVHAATIAAEQSESIPAGGTSCHPEGRSDALVSVRCCQT